MAIYPFTELNGRMFYACMGVLVNGTSARRGRTSQEGTESPTDSIFLTGVQSVGVSSDNPSSSLMDVGRFQRKYHFYAEQSFEITIERVIDKSANFFYNVSTSDYVGSNAGYKACHILNSENIGCQGDEDSGGKSIRNFDITILYGPDQFDRLGSENYTTPTSSNPDKNVVFQVTYRNCLITSINYSMSVGEPIKETITLITKAATYNESTATSAYTLPSAEEAASGDILKYYNLDMLLSSTFQNSSVLPEEVIRMFQAEDSSGDTDTEGNPPKEILGLNSISIDTVIDYSEVADIGRWTDPTDQGLQNIWKFVVLPVQVTASFTGGLRQPLPRRDTPASYLPNTDTTFSKADGVESSKDYQEVDREIKLVAEKTVDNNPMYYVWDLGKKNYLTNFSYSGGDTGGGNLEGTISYQNDHSDIVLARDTVVRVFPDQGNTF